MIDLRDYQAEAVAWIEASWERLPQIGKRRSVVYQLPTGGGKTPIQAALRPDLVIAPGVDLCRQLKARVGCEVLTTTAAARWLKEGRALPPARRVCFDEARSVTSAGVGPVVDWYIAQGARVALFDATPETAQGQGLGRWADDLRQGPSVRELVRRGYLVPSRVFSAEQGRGLARRPVDAWLDLAACGRVLKVGERRYQTPAGRSRRALVFCRDKAHARATVGEFEEVRIPVAFIGDETPEIERQRLLGWTSEDGVFHPGALAEGSVWVLVCAQLLRQGIDIPEVDLVISARAFDSEPLARQAWGRGMRVCPEIGKVDCVMVDLVGGIVERVGLPDDERVWSLEGEACRTTTGEPLPPCVQCRACLAWGRGGACKALVLRGGAWVECGAVLPPPPPPRVQARDLVEVFALDAPEQKAQALVRFVGEAYLAGLAKGKRDKELSNAAWSGAHRWRAKYPAERLDRRAVGRAIRDVGLVRLVLRAWGRILGWGRDLKRGPRQQTIRGVE